MRFKELLDEYQELIRQRQELRKSININKEKIKEIEIMLGQHEYLKINQGQKFLITTEKGNYIISIPEDEEEWTARIEIIESLKFQTPFGNWKTIKEKEETEQ